MIDSLKSLGKFALTGIKALSIIVIALTLTVALLGFVAAVVVSGVFR